MTLQREATLPISGKRIKLQQLTGEDEMAAANEAGSLGDTPAGRIALDHAMVQRSIVSLDGEPFDRSKVIGVAVRNLFDARDWQLILRMFREMHLPTETQAATFLEGGTFTAG